MVKIPDIDQITGGRLAANPNVKPNFQLGNQLTVPYATIAKAATNTGNVIAEYAIALQDQRDKTLSNKIVLQSKQELNEYEQELYQSNIEPDEFNNFLVKKRDEIISKNIFNNKNVKSTSLRDSITSSFTLEFLTTQSRVLKESNTRIEQNHVISTMNSIGDIGQDISQLHKNYSGDELATEYTLKIAEFEKKLEGIKFNITAKTYEDTKKNFYYEAAYNHWMTVTKELSATEILLTSQTLLTDGLTIENSLSNGLDLTLFNKLDDPEAMNKILSAAANDKVNILKDLNTIDTHVDKQTKKLANKYLRNIILGDVNDVDNLEYRQQELKKLKLLDEEYVPAETIEKAESYAKGEQIFSTITNQSVMADLQKDGILGTLTIDDVFGASENLTRSDFDKLINVIDGNIGEEKSFIVNDLLTNLGILEQQLDRDDDELINLVTGEIAAAESEMRNYIFANKDKVGTTDFEIEKKRIINQSIKNMIETLKSNVILDLSSNDISSAFVDFNDFNKTVKDLNTAFAKIKKGDLTFTVNGVEIPVKKYTAITNALKDKQIILNKISQLQKKITQ